LDRDLAEFCRVEYRRLVGLLSLYCRDRHLAEELAQDALVRVVSHWDTVRTLNAPSAWTYRVAINLANSHLRRLLAERRASKRLMAGAVTVQSDPDTPTAVAVRDAVSALPKRQRAVIVLRFFADLSVREVSELLSMPEGTVKTLTAAGLARLRTAMHDRQEVTDAS